MPIKPFIHTSLFIALMLGEISIGGSNSFYEDDEEFKSTKTPLNGGWGWYHINSANASCTEQTECLTVIGVPAEEEDYGPIERDNDEPRDLWDYEPSDGGGDLSTTENIEIEQKKIWCEQNIANLPIAISSCETNARLDYSYAFQTICNNETSRTYHGGVTIYIFGGSISYEISCAQNYENIRDATLSRCASDGLKVEKAIKDQCK